MAKDGREPPDPPAVPGEQWARLHPLTPVLRGWRALGAVAAFTAQDGLRHGGLSGFRLLITLAFVLPVAGLTGYVSWRRRRWRVEGGDLRLDYGVFTRKSRRVPLARLQAIDVVRPLLARALGLAELRLDVVGHGTTEANLAYLTESHALEVRAHLLDLAHAPAGALPAPAPASAPRWLAPAGPDAETSPTKATWGRDDEVLLAAVPLTRFVISLALSASGAFAAVLIAAVVLSVLVTPALAGGIIAAMLPIGATLYRRFTVEFGFTVSLSPQGVRLRHGLLDTRQQTVPRGRVQAVRIVEPLLWRRFGWVRVEIDVAGHRGAAAEEERAASAVLLPVARRADAEAVIQTVLPGLRLDHLQLVRPPTRARWRAPLSFPHLASAFDTGWSVTSYGRIRVITDVVPHEKLQSVRRVQGPLQRRLGLATVHLDTAGRNVRAAIRHTDAQQASLFTGALAELARTARSRQR